MRGQLSAEMLILITVVLAIVAIAATQLIGTAKETGEQISESSSHMLNVTESAMYCGNICYSDEDCGGSCPTCGSDNKCA